MPPSWPLVVDGYHRALEKGGIAGSSLMVVHGGRIVARDNFGLQNRQPSEPITNDTIYHWASITKTFTGIATMQLRDPSTRFARSGRIRTCSFEPGSKYSYSNPGVIFLGRIIQQLSGDDYEVYVTKNRRCRGLLTWLTALS